MPDKVNAVGHVLTAVSTALVLALVVTASPASAHASLIASTPATESSLPKSPSSVTLTFNEDMSEPAYVAVVAPDGSKVPVEGVSITGATVTAQLVGSDQRGRFVARYRVVSKDAHPVEGSIRWTTTTGRRVEQVEPTEDTSFLRQHSAHLFWGILGAAVAVALVLAPLRRRDDKNDA